MAEQSSVINDNSKRGKKRYAESDENTGHKSQRVAYDDALDINEGLNYLPRILGDATLPQSLIHSLASRPTTNNTVVATTALKSRKFFIKDYNVGHVQVIGPGLDWHGSDDSTYRLILSESDVEFFDKHGVCVVLLLIFDADKEKKNGHALCLIRNNDTGVCELYDPMGALFTTYTGTEITGGSINQFTHAVHSGLFGPLVSPIGSQNTFNVVCKSSLKGLQLIEIDRSDPTQYEFFESLDEDMQTKFVNEFKDAPGFCKSWVYFRYFDQYFNDQILYRYVEINFIRPNYSTSFENAVVAALLDKFCEECSGLNKDLCTEILTCMSLSIFIRLFALFQYVCSKKEDDVAELYERFTNTDDDTSIVKVIAEFIKNLYDYCELYYGQYSVFFYNMKHWKKTINLVVQNPIADTDSFILTKYKNGKSAPLIRDPTIDAKLLYAVSLDTGENKYTIN